MSGGTPLGKMVIELGLDSTDFGKGLDGAKKMTNYAMKEMQANMKIYDTAGDKLGKFQAQQTGLSKVIDSQRQKVEALKKAYDGSFVDGKPTEQTAKFATQLQQANGQLAAYNKQLANSAGEMAKWKIENTGITGGLNTFGQKLTSIGDGAAKFGDNLTTKVTAPIVGVVAASVKAAMDWESAFAGVKKTNDEVVDSTGKVVYSYKDLEDGLRTLAKELPASHQEIAATAEAAGQLGIQTENVVGFTKTMIDLGESTNMSAEEAATALARLANITGMPQTEFDKLGSVIVALGNNFATTESEITAMGLRLAGAGSQVGMSESQIMSFAAALSSVGVEAEAGGSAFSKVMVQMQLAVEKGTGAFSEVEEMANQAGMSIGQFGEIVLKGGKNAKQLAEALGTDAKSLRKMYKEADKSKTSLENFANVAGMSGEQFSKAFKDDAAGAIISFIKGLGEAEKHGTSAIKVLDDMEIKEVRLRDSLLRAAGASGVFTDAIEMGSKAWDENTALSKEAGQRYETTESQLKMLKNEVVDIGIEFGGPFLKALRDGVQASKPLIQTVTDLAKKFSQASPETQKMIMKTIAFTAAAGPMLSIVGRLTSGLGGLTTKTIGFIGVLAKKKTVAEFTTQLVSGSKDLIKWGSASKSAADSAKAFGPQLASSSTQIAKFGTAASTAAGSSGVGAITGALGALGPVALGIVGAGGILAIGYGAWKLWGEEAWNAGQRTKRWGTDVGEATDETLTSVKNYTTQASGQFDLMSQGLGNNSNDMADNFVKVGETIEQSLIKKIEGLDKLIKELPASVDGAVREMVEEEKKQTETALETVQKNNERIYEMKKNASDKGVELSVIESKIIQDLAEQSTRAYVDTLDLTANEKKKILDAMNGDVSKASDEEARLWLQSLGKQRQAAAAHMTASKKEKEKYLEDLGYNLDGEFAQKFMEAWNEINQTTVDGFDQQMATIVEKYPELMDEVFLANGQLISSMGEYGQGVKAENEKIIDSVKDMTSQIGESADKNAKDLQLVGKEGTKAGSLWNSIVLDDKKANVKTNAQEELNKATKSSDVWKSLAFHSKEANLSSNAKLMLAEAAIANGHWETMSWKDKTAVIESNSTQTIIRAMQDSGDWDKLSFEQKKAVLYSDTPEKVGRAVSDLGLWNEMGWRVHQLKADNHDYLNKINMTKEYLDRWNQLPVDIKDIMLDNTEYSFKILESEENYRRFSSLPDDEKKLIAKNEQLVTTIVESESMYIRWSQMPDETKRILGNNVDLLNKVIGSEASYDRWLKLPEIDKNILGNNSDLLAKVFSSSENYKTWMALPEKEKILIGNNGDILNKLGVATGAINTYNSIDTPTKSLNSETNAVSAKGSLDDLLWSWNQIPLNQTKTQTIKQDFIGPQLPGHEKGTNYHQGGLAVVNDQKGSLYKEFIQYPDGRSFIPQGRNVIIDMPRGAKVMPAKKTKEMFPQYAKGIGVFKNSQLMQSIARINEKIEVTIENKQKDQPFFDERNFAAILVSALKDVRFEPKIVVPRTNNRPQSTTDTMQDIEFMRQIGARGKGFK
ncbi:phage tail tape measure protein [Enterococcus rotai]|uniref:phage tail tape measure protein n=1 Tax=Enterococcus rotai TaxID=118060 RepID=UPI0032B3DF19